MERGHLGRIMAGETPALRVLVGFNNPPLLETVG